jgi:hypothetical protein
MPSDKKIKVNPISLNLSRDYKAEMDIVIDRFYSDVNDIGFISNNCRSNADIEHLMNETLLKLKSLYSEMIHEAISLKLSKS